MLWKSQGSNLQIILYTTILRLPYDNAKVTAYNVRLIYKTSYEGGKAFLSYDLYLKSRKIVGDNVRIISLRYS